MIDDGPWSFDFDGWTMAEDMMYLLALDQARKTGIARPLYPHLARMVRRWPYKLDPANLNSYEELDESQFNDLIERIGRGIGGSKDLAYRAGGAET